MGTQLSLSESCTSAPTFRPCLLWPNSWMDQDTIRYGVRPRPRRHCVRRGLSCPSPKGAQPPFRPMSVVAKRLDGLRCHLVWGRPRPRRLCVRWGPSPSPEKRAQPHPIFDPCLLWPNGWMDQDATWCGGRPKPRPRRLCVRWGPSSP